jgi:thiamine kinase-like enzyme
MLEREEIINILALAYNFSNIQISPINIGLWDQNFKIICDQGVFFGKKYKKANEALINEIHYSMSVMKDNLIPVARPIPPKNNLIELENIRVYSFIEGSSYISNTEQLSDVASIYQKILLIGLKKQKLISKPDYIASYYQIPSILNNWQDFLQKQNESQAVFAVQKMKQLAEYFHEKIANFPQELMISCQLHCDFTERNLLFNNNKIVLVCDWQAYKYRMVLEQVYSTIARFCTSQPLEGILLQERLQVFLSILIKNNPEVRDLIWQGRHWFSVLGASTHLRLMNFRLNMFFREKIRLDLMDKFFYWAVDYCEWLISNQKQLSELIEIILTI